MPSLSPLGISCSSDAIPHYIKYQYLCAYPWDFPNVMRMEKIIENNGRENNLKGKLEENKSFQSSSKFSSTLFMALCDH